MRLLDPYIPESQPKMQNKHKKMFDMGGPPPGGGGGGIKPVGQNDQVLQKTVFYGSPNHGMVIGIIGQ